MTGQESIPIESNREITLQTNNEVSLPKEVENNASNFTLSVKERVGAIELLEKGTKCTSINEQKHVKQNLFVTSFLSDHDLKQCNITYKQASLNVASYGSDSSITPKVDEVDDEYNALVRSLTLDDDEGISDEFDSLVVGSLEESKRGYNHPYSFDQIEAASNTSSNSETYSTIIKVQKDEEVRESGDKLKRCSQLEDTKDKILLSEGTTKELDQIEKKLWKKPEESTTGKIENHSSTTEMLSRNVMLQQDNNQNVAPPSPRTAENAIHSFIMKQSNQPGAKYIPDDEKESSSDESIQTICPVEEGQNTQFSKKSVESDSGISKGLENESEISDQSPGMKRSVSEVTLYSESCKTCKELLGNEPSISPTSFILKDDTDIKSSEADSETPLISSSKKTNRTWPRVKYAVQQKEFIIFGITAIALSTSAALVYLQDKAQTITFFVSSPLYVTMPIIALASLIAISPMFYAIKQFRNTEECQIQRKNADETLNKVLEYQAKDKVIKSVRLKYSNGTHSNFTLNAWEGKNNFINIDEKVISRTNKIESVIKDRPIFMALLTGVIATNIAFPLGLLALGGMNNLKIFYQNPLSNNMGLSLLMGSSMVALLVICFGVHYYRKTNCTNLVYSEERIDPEKVNERFIEEIKEERTKVLEENHSKDAKRSSLTLEQVVVESHNYKDTVYSI